MTTSTLSGPDVRNAPARLLGAAERIINEEGLRALTTRRIAELARSNLSQINYYFQGLDGLIDALLLSNIACVNARRSKLREAVLTKDAPPQLLDLLEAFLRPVWTPAAHCEEAFAAVVVQEIYRHAGPASRTEADALLQAHREPLIALMARQVPHLDEDRLRIRTNLLISAATSLIPRTPGWLLHQAGQPADPESLFAELCAVGMGALQAPVLSAP